MATFCIFDSSGTVVTVFANSQPEFQGTSGYNELPVDGGQVGQQWNGTAFVAGPVKVPQTVTAFQAKAVLVAAGLYAQVNTYMTTTAPQVDQLAWQCQQTYSRNDSIIANMAVPLGLTSAQLDNLFIEASQISP